MRIQHVLSYPNLNYPDTPIMRDTEAFSASKLGTMESQVTTDASSTLRPKVLWQFLTYHYHINYSINHVIIVDYMTMLKNL